MGMNNYDWPLEFRNVYQAGLKSYDTGERTPEKLFNKTETEFLRFIGCTPQEMFDFIDDLARYGEPEYETVLLIQSARRDYLVAEQKGVFSTNTISMDALPAKTDEVDGIAWLPRLIEKARAKLKGEMPADLMFGCGGDRPFLRGVNVEPSEFLRLVWSAKDDNRKIVDYVKKRRDELKG